MAIAFQKVYTQISQITKATCSLKAKGVGYDELATINGKLAQVVKIMGDNVTLQVFEGTGGIPTNAEVTFLGKGFCTIVFCSWDRNCCCHTRIYFVAKISIFGNSELLKSIIKVN